MRSPFKSSADGIRRWEPGQFVIVLLIHALAIVLLQSKRSEWLELLGQPATDLHCGDQPLQMMGDCMRSQFALFNVSSKYAAQLHDYRGLAAVGIGVLLATGFASAWIWFGRQRTA